MPCTAPRHHALGNNREHGQRSAGKLTSGAAPPSRQTNSNKQALWASDAAKAKNKPATSGMGMAICIVLGGHLKAGLCLNSKTLQRAQMRTASNSHHKETAGATHLVPQCFSKHRPRYRKAPKKGAFRRDHSAIRQVSTDNSAEPNRLELADQIQTLMR